MIGKERKKRTDMLAKLYGETNDLLAEMERSTIAGLKKGSKNKKGEENEGKAKIYNSQNELHFRPMGSGAGV